MNAFFKQPRTCNNRGLQVSEFREILSTYGGDVIDRGRSVWENTELRVALGFDVAHLGGPATVCFRQRVSVSQPNQHCDVAHLRVTTLTSSH